VREDPIISGAWIKAALVILVAGALGVGAYLLASGTDINLPDLPDLNTSTAQTTLNDTTLQDTTLGEPVPQPAPEPKPTPTTPSSGPTIEDLKELGRCTQAANGDFDRVQECFDRFNGQR
jgi:hypothetical protein